MSTLQQLRQYAISIKEWLFTGRRAYNSGVRKKHKKLIIPDARIENNHFGKKAALSDFTIL